MPPNRQKNPDRPEISIGRRRPLCYNYCKVKLKEDGMADTASIGPKIPGHVPPHLVYVFDQMTPEFARDPYGVFERMRGEAPPIFFTPPGEREMHDGAWCLTRAA